MGVGVGERVGGRAGGLVGVFARVGGRVGAGVCVVMDGWVGVRVRECVPYKCILPEV